MKAAVLYEAGRPMPGGAIGALTDLRDQGVLGYLGVAGGEVPLLREFVATGLLDVVLSPSYACRPTGEAVRDAVRAMQRACAGYGVPLAAAALQFSLRDPRVTSTRVHR